MQDLTQLYGKTIAALEESGNIKEEHTKAAVDRMVERFIEIKFPPAFVDRLTHNLRNVIDRIRRHERMIRDICISDCKMPRKEFLSSFISNESSADWLQMHIDAEHPWSSKMNEYSWGTEQSTVALAHPLKPTLH